MIQAKPLVGMLHNQLENFKRMFLVSKDVNQDSAFQANMANFVKKKRSSYHYNKNSHYKLYNQSKPPQWIFISL